MGRPHRVAAIDECRKVRTLAGAGLTTDQIAAKLGITARTLFRRMDNDPALKSAYREGQKMAKAREHREADGKPANRSRQRIDPATIRELGSQGASMAAIARALGTSTGVLRKRLEEEPELEQAVMIGKAELVDVVTGALARNARAGDVASARLLLERLLPERGVGDAFQALLKRRGYI